MQYWLVHYPLESGLVIIFVTIATTTLLSAVVVNIFLHLCFRGVDAYKTARSRSKTEPPFK
jgi:hypothetical protein